MPGIELASAYITLIPSLKGAGKTISAQLGGVDVSKAGRKIGESLGGSIGAAVPDDAFGKLGESVKRAEADVSKAMAASEDAVKRAAAAQARYDEAVERHGKNSSQALSADLALAKAKRQQAEAAARLDGATSSLATAQKQLKLATDASEAALARQSSAAGRLSAAMGAASASLSAAGSHMESLGGSLGRAGDAVMPVSAGLVAAGAAAGGFALRTASAAETAEIGFSTMLGSEEAALAMMQELADFAARTPFELSGLQTAARQLLAYGFTAEEVVPMLTAVGDATAALGTGQQGIDAVTRALGQMQTRGKVSAEEMLQLTEAGVPAWEYLADAIGTDTAGAMDMVTKGAVDAETGIRALLDGMEGAFGGMMAEQAGTLAGTMSNLADAIERPLMELRKSDGYERLSESLADVVDSAGPFVESLLPHMERGLEGAAGALDAAADAMDAFAGMGEEGQSAVIGMVAAAAGAGPALKVASVAVGGLGKGAKAMGSLVGGASDAIAGMASASDGAAKSAGRFAGGLGTLKGGVAGLALGGFALTVAAVSNYFAEAAAHEELLADATMSMTGIADAAAASIGGMGRSTEDALRAMADLNGETVEAMAELQVQSGVLDRHVATIERLADQSGLTASEQMELEAAVDGYNQVTGESVEVTDAANGKLSASSEELRKNADAWRENAEAQAYQSVATEYLEEHVRLQGELAQKQGELAAAQERLAKMSSGELAIDPEQLSGELSLARSSVERLTGEVDELSAATEAAGASWEGYANMAAVSMAGLDAGLKEAVQGLPASMQTVGLDVATALGQGVAAGTVSVDEAACFLTSSLGQTVAGLPPAMQQGGMDAVSALATAISGGSITAGEAAAVLTAAVNGDVSTLPTSLQGYGAEAAAALGTSLTNGSPTAAAGGASLFFSATGAVSALPGSLSGTALDSSTGFAGGIGAGVGPTEANAAQLASATEAAKANNEAATGWGSELAGNFAAGISSMIDVVAGAAGAVASAIADLLHFTEPDKGPLVGINRSGYEMARNYAAAMSDGVPLVARASEKLAAAAAFEGPEFGGFGAKGSSWRPSAQRPTASPATAADVYDAFVAAIEATRANRAPSVSVDGRELASALAPQMGVRLGRIERRRERGL